MRRRWPVFILSLATTAIFSESPVIPGDYDRVLLGVDGDLVTGYFRDCTGECKFSCDVFFEGRRSGDEFVVSAYYPGEAETVQGLARVRGKNLSLRLKTLPGGCWNVAPEFDKDGVQVLLNERHDWLQIRVLREKSPLYSRPRGEKSAVLEAQQTVIVLRKDGEWFFVRKPGAETLRGWLKSAQFFPLRTIRPR